MPVADTQYSYAIPQDTRKITIKPRIDGALMKIAYVDGDIAAGDYISFRGSKTIENAIIKNQTLYFASDKAADTAEIEIFNP